MNITLGLLAMALILWAHILLGWKKRYAFLIMAGGNALWMYVVLYRYPIQLDLLISSTVFLIISVRNWILWKK